MSDIKWREFAEVAKGSYLDRPAVLREINNAIAASGWGKIDENGRLTALEREPETMEGSSAREFSDQSEILSGIKYGHIVQKIQRLTESLAERSPLIADLGAGPGILTRMVALQIPTATVVGIDSSQDMVDIAMAGMQKLKTGGRLNFTMLDIRDAPKYFESQNKMPDLVISRNMLHRADNLDKALLSFVNTAKDSGGIVYSISFLNPQDFDEKELNLFLNGIKNRISSPDLLKAWTLAYLNAPTFKQYSLALSHLSEKIATKRVSLEREGWGYVRILIQKEVQTGP